MHFPNQASTSDYLAAIWQLISCDCNRSGKCHFCASMKLRRVVQNVSQVVLETATIKQTKIHPGGPQTIRATTIINLNLGRWQSKIPTFALLWHSRNRSDDHLHSSNRTKSGREIRMRKSISDIKGIR